VNTHVRDCTTCRQHSSLSGTQDEYDRPTATYNAKYIITFFSWTIIILKMGTHVVHKGFATTRLKKYFFILCTTLIPVLQACRSQWLRLLRHEMSSLAWTLESWIRIPFKAWMSVCVYSVFVLFCVQAAILRRAYPLFSEFYQMCIRLRV
jgi:hypothetical protein